MAGVAQRGDRLPGRGSFLGHERGRDNSIIQLAPMPKRHLLAQGPGIGGVSVLFESSLQLSRAWRPRKARLSVLFHQRGHRRSRGKPEDAFNFLWDGPQKNFRHWEVFYPFLITHVKVGSYLPKIAHMLYNKKINTTICSVGIFFATFPNRRIASIGFLCRGVSKAVGACR